MTLYRQLLISLLLLFLILFASTWYIKLQSTRTFLEEQLKSHAQDTATSLGLSITPYLSQKDLATAETMMNVVFDRGYYRLIKLTDLKGKVLAQRKLNVVISDVPTWFINAIPLKTPKASTLLTSGWIQMGHLYVQSHPGYAYKTLWEDTKNMINVFGVTGIIAFFLGAIGLRILLVPLQRIEKQAEDLCKKQYTFQAKLPKTRELRRVVVAMNSMTAKVKQMFDEQAKVAERLRKNAYSDELTGLGNRRYLKGQVTARMKSVGATVRGAFLLIQVHNLKQIHQEKGYQIADQVLCKIAKYLQETTPHYKNAALSRLSGGSFAIFIPNAPKEDAQDIATTITQQFAGLKENIGYPENIGHVGGVCYDHQTNLNKLLSEADQILSVAQNQGPNAWKIGQLSSESTKLPRGEQEWQKILDKVLAEKNITLLSQSAVSSDKLQHIMHKEILSRITLKTGQMFSAGIFIPFAERLQRISSIDKIVLEKVVQLDASRFDIDKIAVNISPTSLKDPTFVSWILSSLRKSDRKAPRIIFEFPEFLATQQLKTVLSFANEVKGLGHFIGLDHFGQSFANFGYLKSLQPRYVKIDRAFTDELKEKESDSHFFISSLAGVAHSIDILVIAEGVEEELQYQILCDLNIDGIQGFYVDKPVEV